MVDLHEVRTLPSEVPRFLHGLGTRHPLHFLKRVAEVGVEVAGATLLDGISPLRRRVLKSTLGRATRQGNSLAFYVHWSPSGRVSTMVRRQIATWKSYGFDIVFITNASPPVEDWEAISDLAVLLIKRANTGRDFGAWRDGVAVALNYLQFPNEVLLANDSVLGPIRPLLPIVSAWREGGEGFFGMTESIGGGIHLQSYAVVARGQSAVRSLFNHLSLFRDSRSKWLTVRRGEIALTWRMRRDGHRCAVAFSHDAVCKIANEVRHLSSDLVLPLGLSFDGPLNPTHHLWSLLIERMNFPYLKTDLLLRNPSSLSNLGRWRSLVSVDDVALVREHLGIMAARSLSR